jgi:hypothetical protein
MRVKIRWVLMLFPLQVDAIVVDQPPLELRCSRSANASRVAATLRFRVAASARVFSSCRHRGEVQLLKFLFQESHGIPFASAG